MSLTRVHYRGWDIVPFAMPTPGGAWEATCEVERQDELGVETYQALAGPFREADKEEAIARAITDAMHKIDDMNADPLH